MKPRKRKHSPSHPWVAAGDARIAHRQAIRRRIAESIAAMRRPKETQS